MKIPEFARACAETDVQSITLHQDGATWEATVGVGGVSYTAVYVGARLQVRLAANERPSRRRTRQIEAVRVWSLAKILALPPEWHARHEVLHGVREQQEAIRLAVLERLKVA